MTARHAIRFLLLLGLCYCTAAAADVRRPANKPARAAPNEGKAGGQAVEALFIHSDIDGARAAARQALAQQHGTAGHRFHNQDLLDALFVTMEAAALQADVHAELDAAIRLCEMSEVDADARVAIAAARILDLAANTSDFRALVPRIRTLIAAESAQTNYLRAALLAAATDGTPGLKAVDLSRESGLLTDWRIAGPFGTYSNIAFDQSWAPERDALARATSEGNAVEQFRFENGTVELPDYFPTDGVFYAAGDLTIAAAHDWRLRVESPGTLQVFIDGAPAITKDDRFRATPEVAWTPITLTAGTHRVLVKFLPSAAPFRLALVALQQTRAASVRAITNPTEAAYVSAAHSFWTGDYSAAIQQLTALRAKHESAALDLLLAQAWQHADESAGESNVLAHQAIKLAPEAWAAEYQIAFNAFAQQHLEDAAEHARNVLQVQPRFEPALRVFAAAAARMGWASEAAQAHEAAAAIHRSCRVLQDTANFFASVSEFDRAARFTAQLASCAPGSLAWPDALSDAGRHADAASALREILKALPLARTARAMLVRELALAGNAPEANKTASELVAIAPGSGQFRRMQQILQHGGELTQAIRVPMTDFADAQQFYSKYSRDALNIIHHTAQRRFSGGPAVVLLHDRIAELMPDGHVALYVHKITRVLDRDGISQYGEVAVPNGAGILALRTIKLDGTIAEPEFNQHKATISMPALAPGDAIDVEYVLRYPDGGIDDHSDAFEFTFGSFAAPVLLSRFIVIAPAEAPLQFAPTGNVPTVQVDENGRSLTHIWERNDIAQSVSEVSMPRTGVLPSIRVLPATTDSWAAVRDFYRDPLIEATRIGSRVESIARQFSGNDEQKLRAAYRLVTTRIHPAAQAFDSGDLRSAEQTLATYNGSRTTTLIAIAQAIGIPADLLMARDTGAAGASAVSPHAYTRPLILFHVSEGSTERQIVVDAESDGIGFGGIAPTLERNDALLVPLRADGQTANPITRIPVPILDDRSVAEGDVSLDAEGNLSASLAIRMGAARSAQMRSILSGIEQHQRQHFFEQLAMRIFPGASETSGEVRNEFDPDHPLELTVHCRGQHFVNFGARTADLDQLVPALGLRKMYATAGPRHSPLYLDTPLFEVSTFHVQLPATMRFVSIPREMNEQNDFGSYSVTFRSQAPNRVDIRREFRIPVQVVDPIRFDSFSQFARRVDDAERQRLTVERLDDMSATAAR